MLAAPTLAPPTTLPAVSAVHHDDRHHRAAPTPAAVPAQAQDPAAAAGPLGRVVHVAAQLGSVITLSALALLCVAMAAGIVSPSPDAGPTITVTYDAAH